MTHGDPMWHNKHNKLEKNVAISRPASTTKTQVHQHKDLEY